MVILTRKNFYVAFLWEVAARVIARLSSILYFTALLISPLSEHFFLKATFFPVDLQNIFRAWEIDIMSKTDIFQRILHDCDFIYKGSSLFIIDFAIFHAATWFHNRFWFLGESFGLLWFYRIRLNNKEFTFGWGVRWWNFDRHLLISSGLFRIAVEARLFRGQWLIYLFVLEFLHG